MAEVVNIEPGSLRATLDAMNEPELIAQQITQQGAMHALTTLVDQGCTEQVAQDMLASLRSNMLVIEAVARGKGFARLFAEGDDAPRVPTPAEQFHEVVLAIVRDLMHSDPAADSADGRVLVRLADAVEAYEKVVYPMPPAEGALDGCEIDGGATANCGRSPMCGCPAALAALRLCGNENCGWSGETDRMLGTIGPLCPECGEVTELVCPQGVPK